jgi:hypothetical protein
MSSKVDLLCNQLSGDQINQINLGFRGAQPINNSIEVDEPDVNNGKMASYSQVVSGNNYHLLPFKFQRLLTKFIVQVCVTQTHLHL